LQRATVTSWAVALLVLGLTLGSFSDSVTGMVAGNERLSAAFAVRGAVLTDSYAAAVAMYLGLCAAAFAVGSVLRLRAEESAGRSELLLAAALDRRRLLGSGLAVTAAAATLLLLAGGLGSGLATAAVRGDPAQVGRQLGAALVQLPAVLLVAAVAALLVGLLPRWSALAWAVVVWALVVGLFGPLLDLPRWAVRLSPLGWVPRVPAEPLDVVPLLGLLLGAAVLGAGALAAFRRRDVPA
jgi:ABC-2 type transport system permease protein